MAEVVALQQQAPDVQHQEQQEQLDQQMSAERVDPEEYLGAFADQNFNFLNAIDHVDLDTDCNLEIRRLREHFSQLKMEYLFLEAKQGMLECVASQSAAELLEAHKSSDFKQTLSDAKKKVHETNSQVVELKRALREAIPKLVAQHEALTQKQQHFEGLYDKENSKAYAAAVQQAQQGNNAHFGKASPKQLQMDSLESCQAVLAGQQQTSVAGAATIAAQQQQLETAIKEANELTLELAELETRLEALKNERARGGSSGDRSSAWDDKVQWYQSIARIMSVVNHTHTVLTDDGVIVVSFGNPATLTEHPTKLHIQFTPDGTKFTGATFVTPTTTVNHASLDANLVNHAVGMQNLPLLVGEAQSMLQRPRQADVIGEVFAGLGVPHQIEGSSAAIFLSVGSSQAQARITLEMSPDFPAMHAPILVRQLHVEHAPAEATAAVQAMEAQMQMLQVCQLSVLVDQLRTMLAGLM